MSDQSKQLAEKVIDAYKQKTPLSIQGMQSKSFLKYRTHGTALNTIDHNGIIAYEPTELVMTVRAGTSIKEVSTTLLEQNQVLAFDPPRFQQKGTIGGAISTGLSGPARPWLGAARDFVLGTRIINGKGEILSFGGQVMKNVAGYDVSRLMAGAFGTLGLILDVSFKVLPAPQSSTTLSIESTADEAIERMNHWSGQSIPITGACWVNNILYLRLAGTHTGIKAAVRKIGGEPVIDSDAFWSAIRDHEHEFFKQTSYWRLSMPPATPMPELSGDYLIDWGGAQRWLKSNDAADKILAAMSKCGGHAEHWHVNDPRHLRIPLEPVIARYHQNLKTAFDPGRVLNNGALYADL